MKNAAWLMMIAGGLGAQVQIPKTWDDSAVASVTVPLAVPDASPVQIPAKYYYGIPVRPIYQSYPVYHPSKEPPGYLDRLRAHEPKISFDPSNLKSESDWIRAGEDVFDAPITFGSIGGPRSDLYMRDPAWFDFVRPAVAKDGTLPFYRYVIRAK